MSSKLSSSTKKEQVQDTYNMHLTTLERRFGKNEMVRGFSGAPLLVKELGTYKEIGMTRTEVYLWECIVSKQRDNNPPWLAVSRIAELMQISERSVQRYLRRLEKKGLLIIHYNVLNIHGTFTNTYDFQPLYNKCIALHDELMQNVAALREEFDAFMRGDNLGDTFVGNSTQLDPAKKSIPTNLDQQSSEKLSSEPPPNEDRESDLYKNIHDSRLRSEKEAFDYNTLHGSDGYTNPSQTNVQPNEQRNDGYIDQDANNDPDQRNRDRDRTHAPQSAGAAGNSVDSVTGEEWRTEATQIIVNFEEQQYLKIFMNDMSAEMHDNPTSYAPNVSRLLNLYREFHHLFDGAYRFGEVVQEARVGAMKVAKVTRRNDKGKPNRVPYFFSVLEDLLVQMHQSYRLSIRE